MFQKSKISNGVKSFLVALKFLTILPVGKDWEIQDKELAKSVSYFPLVGALIGLLLVAVDFIFGPLFPDAIVNLFILIILIIVTGALHLDGFMDSIDGLFSGQNKNRILEIMRDSKIGSFGILAVICLLSLKFSFLNEMQPAVRYPVLILMPALSRWGVVYLAKIYPYARKGKGIGEPFAKLVGEKELIGATLFMAILIGLLLQLKGIVIWLGVFMVLILLGRWINRKISGMTGDTYGAIIETIEVVFLVSVYCINSINLSLYAP
ncbi:MAG: adenosylcobinamide-GDP ribazoletransferase [Candidatus Doudnabacteria bacterium]